MSRVLFSWIAYNHDFTFAENGLPIFNPEGAHGDCYKHNLFIYNKHVLLSKASKLGEDNRFERVVNGIKENFKKTVIPYYMDIADSDIVNIEVLTKKLEKLLVEYAEDDIEAYISPGTPAMQTAWYLLAYKFENLKLFQVDPPKFRANKPPNKKWIKILKTFIPPNLNLYAASIDKPDKHSKILKTAAIQKFYNRATKVAQTYDITTLILGETGTGKEFLAKHIHDASNGRNKKEFIPINCAQLTDSLLESRLFGTKAGSYTDAKDSLGAFREADKGTLFLDEIGDITPRLQQTLLRVLETKEVSPVGSFKEKHKVDVRVIAATHKNLFDLVENGLFRRDLYHRLYIADVETIPYRMLPPKEQEELFNFIVENVKKKHKVFRKEKLKFSKEAKRCLENYKFPGNMRELHHLIERLNVFCETEVQLEDLPHRIQYPEGTSASLKLKDVKNRHIMMVYKMKGGNLTKTSEVLGEGGTKNTIRPIIEAFNQQSDSF